MGLVRRGGVIELVDPDSDCRYRRKIVAGVFGRSRMVLIQINKSPHGTIYSVCRLSLVLPLPALSIARNGRPTKAYA